MYLGGTHMPIYKSLKKYEFHFPQKKYTEKGKISTQGRITDSGESRYEKNSSSAYVATLPLHQQIKVDDILHYSPDQDENSKIGTLAYQSNAGKN